MSNHTPQSRPRSLSLLVSLALGASLVALGIGFRTRLAAWFTGGELDAPAAAARAMSARAAGSRQDIDHYTCSMHPSVKQAGPGKCPICSMDLIPVSKQQQAEGVVLIDERRRQLIGVRTSAVTTGALRRSFKAVGHVTYDESALTDVTSRVHGWITQLLVNETGQRVSRGQALFSLYSPELYSAEQDFLLATRGADSLPGEAGSSRALSFARAARTRLNLLGLSDAQIDAISAKGEPRQSTVISSPAAGFVIEKNVVEGASVDAGARLFRIAALNKVWVEADVYAADLAHVRLGQLAKVTLDYLPDQVYDAKISYVFPYLEAGSRTGRVRIELANRALELRPGMYATVELTSELGSGLRVPAAAVVYTGPRRLVFVDLGEGRFRPQEVRVGSEAAGSYEILEGLAAGDRVATSGVFLIAAEARISTEAKYWEGEATAADAGVLPEMSAPPRPAQTKPAPRPTAASPLPKPVLNEVYSCPMHPEVKQKEPGKCPICGMNLQRRAGTAKP